MQIKRKSVLFRFMTLRSTEEIAHHRKLFAYVSPPDDEASHFLRIIDPGTDSEAQHAALQTAVVSFVPYSNLEALRSVMETGFWDFSDLLFEKSRTITASEIQAHPGITRRPTAEVLVTLWDNLFYEILEDRDRQLRERLLRLLRADAFLEVFGTNLTAARQPYAENEDEFLRRLAQRPVVIPESFRAPNTGLNPTMTAPAPGHRLQRAHLNHRIQSELDQIDRWQQQLERYEFQYLTQEQTRQRQAYTQYLATVEGASDQYIAEQNPEPAYDKDGLRIVDEFRLPYGLADQFSYMKSAPFDPSGNPPLDSGFTSWIVDQNLTGADFKSVERQLRLVRQALETAFEPIESASSRTFAVHGQKIKGASVAIKTFALSQLPFISDELLLSLDLHEEVDWLEDFALQVTTAEETFNFTEYNMEAGGEGMVHLQIPVPGLDLSGKMKRYAIQMQAKTANGKSYTTQSHLRTGGPVTTGVMGNDGIPGDDPVAFFGLQRLGIADYRRIEQEWCCYVPGEVSHIENIMAKEYKERHSRHLTSSERISETTRESEIEEINDTVSTDRFEMSTEVAAVIQQDNGRNQGFSSGASGEKFGVSFSANGYSDFSVHQSRSESNAIARNYAEDVTNRALERIVQRNTVRRTARMLREYEDNTRHGFDNRDGATNVTGVYRWVDKVYRNQVMNYGQRLVYEFMIPEPARWYKEAIILDAPKPADLPLGDQPPVPVVPEPIHPRDHGLNSHMDVLGKTIGKIAALYGVNIPAPPAPMVTIASTYGQAVGSDNNPYSYSYSDLLVPTGYECKKVRISGEFSWQAFGINPAYLTIGLAGKVISTGMLNGSGTLQPSWTEVLNPISGTITIAFNVRKMAQWMLSVEGQCFPTQATLDEWKQDCYDAVMAGYQNQLDKYQQALLGEDEVTESTEESGPEHIAQHPNFNADLVRTEMKRVAIDMMMRQAGYSLGRNFYAEGPCKTPVLLGGEALDKYAEQVKFFEQAFDWALMAYLFYPYYWAQPCDWKQLFQSRDHRDHIFQAFLQSGMGRMVVPVREGFEASVLWFMKTGEIWEGSAIAFDSEDKEHLSILDELKDSTYAVEDSWETVVPTSLTVLQARSVVLDEGGLPCCEENPDILNQLNLNEDTNVLQSRPDNV